MLRQHVPKLAEADGVSRVECEALKNSINLEIFSEQEKAVLKYVDQVTKGVNVDDNIYGAAAKNLTDRQMVELTVLIGAYNMHGRVMGALRVDLEENP
jgi:alkylhydroperoxidase family enzyme